MRKKLIVPLSIFILTLMLSLSKPTESPDRVSIDFKMVEKGIEWLEFISSGASNEAIKNYFMTHVAPTDGCQSIIHHWARFMEWNNETFYKFIMTALGWIPTDEKIKNKDGSLTALGRRRELWLKALKNTNQLKKDLENIKAIDFQKQSVQMAKQYLPPEAVLEADFYFVLFGHSTAFSVGKENGYDFLQLAKQADGTINIRELTTTFAHELHHTGFDYVMKKNMKDVKNEENILLLGILAAEGMPTYFIDQPWKHLEEYKTRENSLYHEVAADWEKHSQRLKELYMEAEKDIRLNLEGKLGQKEVMSRWMSGYKGAGYVLGADMIGVIDKYLGRKAALDVALDYRRLLLIYNQAAGKAAMKGNKIFIFDGELTEKVSRYKGESVDQ
ncbi:MAG: hypothetical protein PVH61_04185 [Candidatus Aminicenantes bacterium]|jgi:hypothetical protein